MSSKRGIEVPSGGADEDDETSIAGELSVLLSCETFVCAIAARSIERLVLPEDVALAKHVRGQIDYGAAGVADPRIGRKGTDIVRVGQTAYAAWDLGVLLELKPCSSAWIVLRVPHKSGEIPIALRTGPCLIVQEMRAFTRLPLGFFRARKEAFRGAFAVNASDAALGNLRVGLALDVARLFSAAELDASAATLLAAKEN